MRYPPKFCDNDFTVSVEGLTYDKALEKLNKAFLEYVHRKMNFNVSRTARALKISRLTVRVRLKKYFGSKYIPD